MAQLTPLSRWKSTKLFLKMIFAHDLDSVYAWLDYVKDVVVPDSREFHMIALGMWDGEGELKTRPVTRELVHLCEHFPPGEGASILDIGCGFGGRLFYLIDNFPTIASATGIDLLQSHIDQANHIAQTRQQPRPQFLCGDASELVSHLNGRRYDYILLHGAQQDLNHDQFKTLVRACRTLLNDGGLFVLQTLTIDGTLESFAETLAVRVLAEVDSPNLMEVSNVLKENSFSLETMDITQESVGGLLQTIVDKHLLKQILIFPLSWFGDKLVKSFINFVNEDKFHVTLIGAKPSQPEAAKTG